MSLPLARRCRAKGGKNKMAARTQSERCPRRLVPVFSDLQSGFSFLTLSPATKDHPHLVPIPSLISHLSSHLSSHISVFVACVVVPNASQLCGLCCCPQRVHASHFNVSRVVLNVPHSVDLNVSLSLSLSFVLLFQRLFSTVFFFFQTSFPSSQSYSSRGFCCGFICFFRNAKSKHNTAHQPSSTTASQQQ